MYLRWFVLVYLILLSLNIYAETVKLGDEESEYEVHHAIYKEANLLLKEGEKEFETGFQYASLQQNDIRSRVITLPVSYRRSLSSSWEAFVSLPFHYSANILDSVTSHGENTTIDIGDAALGLKYQVLHETTELPGITSVFTTTMPSGNEKDLSNTLEAATGNGTWRIDLDFILNKTYNPIALYALLGFSHALEADRKMAATTVDLQPGNHFKYGFGLGFAVNPRISIGSSFTGRMISRTSLNGNKVNGSSDELYKFNFSTTYKLSTGHFLTPSTRFGLTNEQFEFSVAYSVLYR